MKEEKTVEYLKAIKDTVNEDSMYYEIADYSFDEDENEVFCDIFDIANDFFDAEQTEPMPKQVAEFVEAVYLEEIVERKNGDAANNLGALYYSGRIGEQDFAKAVDLYNKAVELGSRVAAENLGYCYYYGRNIDIDYKKAFHYFALGAFDGHIISLYKIGDMYRNGYYVEKNEKEAFRIYIHCLETLDNVSKEICGADVYMRVADCYAKGIGTRVDEILAYKYVVKACRRFIMRITDGDFMVKGSYKHCVQLEEELRASLEGKFPEWAGF